MKRPRTPPSSKPLGERLELILQAASLTEAEEKYKHWDIVRHLTPPEALSLEEWWFGIKLLREGKAKPIELVDLRGKPFRYAILDKTTKLLHEIDLAIGGSIGVPEAIADTHTKNAYLIRSLMQEAIASSKLEGASTAQAVAKEMLRQGRSPQNHDEQMIRNNFLTMQRLRSWKDFPLSLDLLFEIHSQVTENTLKNPNGVGRFRTEMEKIVVYETTTGELLHSPPPAKDLPKRIATMIAFANQKDDGFMHPVIKGIILHFWLAYEHPFIDGNGRTARALFYWYLIREGYWLFEYLSISEVLLQAPAQYGMAFLYTETDDNDLTYFINHQVDVIEKALVSLRKQVEKKEKETTEIESLLKKANLFNQRQCALLTHALQHPGTAYTIEGHKTSHNIAYESARKDLIDLHEKKILTMQKQGHAFVFIAPNDLENRIKAL